MSIDAETAWLELNCFAERAEVELDQRADPVAVEARKAAREDAEAKGEPDPTKVDETDVSDYEALMTALQSGHMTFADGELVVHWKRSPHASRSSMKLSPEGDDGKGWPYGRALIVLAEAPPSSPANKAHRGGSSDSKLRRLDAFLEVLSGEPAGTMAALNSRKDRWLVTSLGNLLASE